MCKLEQGKKVLGFIAHKTFLITKIVGDHEKHLKQPKDYRLQHHQPLSLPVSVSIP